MNDKQKKAAVHMYQLGTYKPSDKHVRKVEAMVYELAGALYPYRRGKLDLDFFDVFEDDNQIKKR